jgi:ribosomal protein L24E
VEKVALFCNPASGGTFSSIAIEIINGLKFAVAKAKVFLHLEDWVHVGGGIPHVKGHNSVLRLCYSKEQNALKKKL